MMKKSKIGLIGLSLFTFMSLWSCKKDRSDNLNEPNRSVWFTSIINGELNTRSSNGQWKKDDGIGVFMKQNNAVLSNASAKNYKYITTIGNGEFIPFEDKYKLEYPADGSKVDFVAYYPYQQTANDGIYRIDLTNQSSQEAIDLRYSKNLVGVSRSNMESELAFSHKLAKVLLNIEKGEGVSSLAGLEIVFPHMKTKGTFNLENEQLAVDEQSSADINAKVSLNGENALGEALLMPIENLAGYVIVFKLEGKTYTYKLTSDKKFQAGYKYTFNITLGKKITVNGKIGWIELPVVSSNIQNTMLVQHYVPGDEKVRNYTLLYDKEYKLARWVAYPLCNYYMQKNTERTDRWDWDPKILQQYQPDLTSSFEKGYDRGHQMPSADRLRSYELNMTTFYYSNMTAQASKLNQGEWNRLEEKVRAWARVTDTVYVVTGVILDESNIKWSVKGAAIPKAYFKALAKKQGNEFYTIGYRMDNVAPSDGFSKYETTVNAIEQELGYTLFPNIPAEAKAKIDKKQWN